MAEVVNLRLARKRKRRADAQAAAAGNRAAHGRTGPEKAATRAELSARERRLEGHRRDTPDGPKAT